jgi:hypothetical protein
MAMPNSGGANPYAASGFEGAGAFFTTNSGIPGGSGGDPYMRPGHAGAGTGAGAGPSALYGGPAASQPQAGGLPFNPDDADYSNEPPLLEGARTNGDDELIDHATRAHILTCPHPPVPAQSSV